VFFALQTIMTEFHTYSITVLHRARPAGAMGQYLRSGSQVAPAMGSFDPKGMQVACALARRYSGLRENGTHLGESDTQGASCNPDMIEQTAVEEANDSRRFYPHFIAQIQPIITEGNHPPYDRGRRISFVDDLVSYPGYYWMSEIPQCRSP
jgi:hypothetical protein